MADLDHPCGRCGYVDCRCHVKPAMADLDPEAVKQFRTLALIAANAQLTDKGQRALGELCAKLLASWERRGEALRPFIRSHCGLCLPVDDGGRMGKVTPESCVCDESQKRARAALEGHAAPTASQERLREALRQIEREGKSASNVQVLRLASIAREALENKP